METSGEASTWISSATSYDHLSNAPYSQYSLIIIAKSRLSVNWKNKKPFRRLSDLRQQDWEGLLIFDALCPLP